jgi:hypothetical protein
VVVVVVVVVVVWLIKMGRVRIVNWIYWTQFLTTIHNLALAVRIVRIQFTVTRTESSQYAAPSPVLWYGHPTGEVPLPGFPNCVLLAFTAALVSQCNHKLHLLEPPSLVTGYVPTSITVLSASLSSNYRPLMMMLWPTVSRQIRLGVGHLFRAHDQILLFPFFRQKIALLFILGRPLWREDRSVICSAICQLWESRRTHNHTLLSHLRLLESLSVGSYDSQGLRWKYSYPPAYGFDYWPASLSNITLRWTKYTPSFVLL